VVKKAKSKGADALGKLIACEGGHNPAVALYEEIQVRQLSGYVGPYEMLALQEEVDQAVKEGQQQAEAIERTRARLINARSQPAPALVVGF
jgi:hypothetical protein